MEGLNETVIRVSHGGWGSRLCGSFGRGFALVDIKMVLFARVGGGVGGIVRSIGEVFRLLLNC